MVKRGKKGQLTIFIILAILIVAIVLFIFLFWPKIVSNRIESSNPYAYIQTCIEEHIAETTEIVLMNGGNYEINPEMSFFYRGENIRFLCHTNEYYQLCHKQYAFLITHFENQVLENIREEVEGCFQAMQESYERAGYNVVVNNSQDQEMEVRILPGFVSTKLAKEVYLKKGDDNQEYKNFDLKASSNLYDVLEVVENILTWESLVGDSISEAYMIENPYIKVEKRIKEDDVKLYTVSSHRNTGEEFKFATRSLALPPGII